MQEFNERLMSDCASGYTLVAAIDLETFQYFYSYFTSNKRQRQNDDYKALKVCERPNRPQPVSRQ